MLVISKLFQWKYAKVVGNIRIEVLNGKNWCKQVAYTINISISFIHYVKGTQQLKLFVHKEETGTNMVKYGSLVVEMG